MTALSQLKLLRDPFGRMATIRVGRPVQKARAEMLRAIELGATSLALPGRHGSGKTLLLDMMGREFFGKGLSIRRFELEDLAQIAPNAHFNVLLIDDADNVVQAKMQRFLVRINALRPPAMVLFSCASRSIAHAVAVESSIFIELTSLTPDEARSFIVERSIEAGRPDLFEPKAIEALIAGGKGLPGRLVSLGARALLLATSDPSPQILVEHVIRALAEFELPNLTPDSSTTDTPDGIATEGNGSCVSTSDVTQLTQEIASSDAISEQRNDGHLKPGPTRNSNYRTLFRPIAAAASIVGVVLVSALTLNSSSGEVRSSPPPRPISAIRNAMKPLSTEQALAAMEKSAGFLLPHPVVLMVIAPTSLEPLPIADRIISKKKFVNPARGKVIDSSSISGVKTARPPAPE